MIYNFISTIHKEDKRNFFRIPFNIWQTCEKKGIVKVYICNISFECTLIPYTFKKARKAPIMMIKRFPNAKTPTMDVCTVFQ